MSITASTEKLVSSGSWFKEKAHVAPELAEKKKKTIITRVVLESVFAKMLHTKLIRQIFKLVLIGENYFL